MIDLLFSRSKKIRAGDDEADFCLCARTMFSVLGSPILRALGGSGKRGVDPWDERHGEVGRINDMIDVVVLPRGFGDCVLNGLNCGMNHGDSGMVVQEIVTSIAKWLLRALLFNRC